MKIEGVYTALVTPFHRDEVDLGGLRANIRFQIANGVDGILVLGTTGETPTLSESEQEQIILAAREETRDKAVLLVGTGSNSTEHTVASTRRAQELGADAALIVAPYYNKPTQEGLFRHFEAAARSVTIPIVVYNIKGRTGVNIETRTLKRLASVPGIAAVKEASGDVGQIGDVIHEIQRAHEGFTVLSGDDAMTLPLIALGGRGVISVVSNLVPGDVVRMVRAALGGDFTAAGEQHHRLLPLFKAAFIETNPIPIKAAMEFCGLPAGKCRMPLCELEPQNREKLREVLEKLELRKQALAA